MLHWEHESKFKMVPALAWKMGSTFLLLHLFGFSSSIFSYINSKCWMLMLLTPLGRRRTHLGSVPLPSKQRFVTLWWLSVVWYLGSSCPRAGVQWAALPLSECDVLGSSSSFTLGREGSAFLCWWRITLQHLVLPHSGAVLSPLSVATGASKSWLVLLPSSKNLKDRQITSWLFIMYMLHILLWGMLIPHLSGYCYSEFHSISASACFTEGSLS